jgi:AraC-like DNA-binding protein/ligand-binding sensor protein
MMYKCSLIQRREIGPLLLKAGRILKYYEQATGCSVSVLDQSGHSVETEETPKNLFFCKLCKKHSREPNCVMAGDEYPCTQMHIDATGESQRLGGSYIYMCPLGFIFWTSPIYSGGRSVGTLVAGNVIGTSRQEVSEKLYILCEEKITREQLSKYLANIPERSYEDIKAMAQMMLICAEQISQGLEGYGDVPAGLMAEEGATSSPGGAPAIRLIKKEDSKDTHSLPEQERLLLASLRRGDNGAAGNILNDIINIFISLSSGNFELFQIRVIELAVLLSRAATGQERSGAAMEDGDRCLKMIEESKTIEELIENLRIIVNRMGGKIFSFQGVRHASALRKAERFIRRNYTHKISLGEIAGVSGLSAPYFSTIFKEEMGVNLSVYLNRLRVEKAAAMLIETETALSKISEACGFEDQSWFSKIFKNYMGLSPGKYRERGGPILENHAG